MRIQVIGNSAPAKSLRGYLSVLAYVVVVDSQPDYAIFIEQTDGQEIILDSIDCSFERACFRFIRELVDSPVRIQTAGGIQSDRAIRIYVPRRDEDEKAVATGVFRGVSNLFAPRGDIVARGGYPEKLPEKLREITTAKKSPWWRTIWKF